MKAKSKEDKFISELSKSIEEMFPNPEIIAKGVLKITDSVSSVIVLAFREGERKVLDEVISILKRLELVHYADGSPLILNTDEGRKEKFIELDVALRKIKELKRVENLR